MKLPIAIALWIPLVSSENAPETNPQGCINLDEYDADTDFFPEKFVPHETTDLVTVSYHKTYKVVTNVFQEKSYLLYQCGTEPPADEVASGKHHLVLPVPHSGGVAVTQTTQIAPMELLAKRGEISAYIGNPKLVSSPCLTHMMNDETMQTIYIEEEAFGGNLTDKALSDYLEENPDAIVLAGPTGEKDADRHMAIAASQERTAVATFDWLGMYAALFNAEGAANEIIADTEARYECSATNAATIRSSDAEQKEKPKILWAQYFPSQNGWSVASCPTWDETYYCEYAHHCGAELISRPEGMGFSKQYGSPTVYWYVTDEEFLELGKDADTWIYPSKTFEAVYNEKKELLDQFKSVQEKSVYDTQGQGPHAWHEQRLAEYDVVALDMCTLVGTNNPESIHRRRWFRSYFDEPIGGLGTCDAPAELDLAYVPAQAECTVIVATDKVIDDNDSNISDNDNKESDNQSDLVDSKSEETDSDAAAMHGNGVVVLSMLAWISATMLLA